MFLNSPHIQHHFSGASMKEILGEKEIYTPGCLRKVRKDE